MKTERLVFAGLLKLWQFCDRLPLLSNAELLGPASTLYTAEFRGKGENAE